MVYKYIYGVIYIEAITTNFFDIRVFIGLPGSNKTHYCKRHLCFPKSSQPDY